MSKPPSVPFSGQVGGHPGLQTSEDGSLLFKPSLPVEIAFYERVHSDPALAGIAAFVPKFIGKLKLEGTQDQQSGQFAPSFTQEESIVIENVVNSYKCPNILDVKLGKVLYDSGASPEKRERMIKTASKTTTGEVGMRLTGFQVHDNVTGNAEVTSKVYGKSIKVSQLPEGIAKFFVHGEPSHLPVDLLREILSHLAVDLRVLRRALSKIAFRMVGGSVLVVYESDTERVRQALSNLNEPPSMTEDTNDDTDETDEGDDDEDDATEEDSDEEQILISACSVKLIDFAHIDLDSVSDPDEGVLNGLDYFISLIEGRMAELSSL